MCVSPEGANSNLQFLITMANISYKASGHKSSKKNPATLHMNIDGIKFDLIYTKQHGWSLDENASVAALNAFCEYISLDKEWRNPLLQNYINAYYNQVFTNRPEAARSNVIVSYFQWRDSFEKGTVEVLWWSLEKEAVNA